MSVWGALAAGMAAVAAALAVAPGPKLLPRTAAPGLRSEEAAEGLARFRVALSFVAALGATLLVGGVVGLGIGIAVAATVWHVLTRMESPAQRRRREQLSASLPHVVDLMASALSVGCSPVSAVELTARAVDPPMREELLLVTSRLGLGMDPTRVWADVGHHAQLGALGRCLTRAIDSGTPVSEAMYRLGEDLRRNARAAVESRARAVGVKAAAPLGLCLLPAFILIGIIPLVVASIGAALHF